MQLHRLRHRRISVRLGRFTPLLFDKSAQIRDQRFEFWAGALEVVVLH
jgi:hypothetical protein